MALLGRMTARPREDSSGESRVVAEWAPRGCAKFSEAKDETMALRFAGKAPT